MIGTILEIVLVGLKFLDRADQDRIQKRILKLRSDYAEEISHGRRPLAPGESYQENSPLIDSAKLYSLERELRDILQLYSASVQATSVAPKP